MSISTIRAVALALHQANLSVCLSLQVANQRKKYKGWNQKKTGASKEVMRRFDQLQKIGFVFELGRGNAKKY